MNTAKEIFLYAFGAIVILGFLTLLGILIFQGVPEQNSELLYLCLGAFTIMAGNVVSYFFGSSKGSSDKNEMIKEQQKEKTS